MYLFSFPGEGKDTPTLLVPLESAVHNPGTQLNRCLPPLTYKQNMPGFRNVVFF
jgi:hypothetical protein